MKHIAGGCACILICSDRLHMDTGQLMVNSDRMCDYLVSHQEVSPNTMQCVGARLTSWGLSPFTLVALMQMLRKYNNRSSYISSIWFHSSYCYKLYACSLMHTCVHVSKVYCIYRCANYGIINIYNIYIYI